MTASTRDQWLGLFLLVLLSVPVMPGIGLSDDKKAEVPVLKGPAADEIVRLKREVDALETLHHLEATKTQVAGLLALAEKTAAKTTPATEAKASAAYIQTLKDLRLALVQDDEEKIAALFEKLAEIEDLAHFAAGDLADAGEVEGQKMHEMADRGLRLEAHGELQDLTANGREWTLITESDYALFSSIRVHCFSPLSWTATSRFDTLRLLKALSPSMGAFLRPFIIQNSPPARCIEVMKI